MFSRDALIQIDSGDDAPVARWLSERLNQHLTDGKTVLWLVSGGSAIDVAVRTLQLLDDFKSKQLHVGLVDERFGDYGHADSNQTQLVAAGFDLNKVVFHPVLGSGSAESDANDYGAELDKLLGRADYSVGLFGIGADGHTAGLLPGSALLLNDSLYGSYRAADYYRLSATPQLIGRLDSAVVYASGQSKWPALRKLFGTETQLPAIELTNAKDLQVFSDVKL